MKGDFIETIEVGGITYVTAEAYDRLADAARRYLKTGSFTAEMDLHDAVKADERLPDSNGCYRP